jgi:tRNA pseudouridine32 synthase / 23S rRNA pseudouridine746 synthase
MRFVHADEHLVVADKPAGLLAVPGRHEAECLAARVRGCFPDALVVHRLDQPTSGLIVFARGGAAQRALGQAFAARQVDKHYVAVVHGLASADEGRVVLPIAADWPARLRQKVDPVHGKPSATCWRVLDRDMLLQRSRQALQPLSGRTHQLRVHLAAIGHPIVGDVLYGAAPAARLHLHAHRLCFVHPGHGEPVAFESPPPF